MMHELRSTFHAGDDAPLSAPTHIGRSAGASIRSSLVTIPIHRGESPVADKIVLHFRGCKHDARIINLSSGEVVVESAIEPYIGEIVRIRIGEGDRDRCTVRWVRDGRIGLEFAGYSLQMGCSEKGDFVFRRHDHRNDRAPRQAVTWPGLLQTGSGTIAVRLGNVSPGGAMLEGDHDLAPGAEVLLDLGSVGILTAKVRWCEAGRIGIEFDRAFDSKDLARPTSPPEGNIHWAKPEYRQDGISPASFWTARRKPAAPAYP